MSSASAIRMAQAFVEIGGDTSGLSKSLENAKRDLQAFGRGLKSAGMGLMGMGIGVLGALTPAVVAFANYEQALANLQAAASPTAEQFELIKTKVEEVSKATGENPVDVVNTFGELIKAGRTVEEVLGGLGRKTVEFSRVGMLPAADAARILVQGMNVFGVTATEVAENISRAADASTTNIQGISDGFANVGAVASGAGQNIRDTATALGILANRGISGAEGGTALRIVLTRLTTGTDGAQEALQEMGVSAYNADRKVRPLIDIIEDLKRATGSMSEEDRNRHLFALGGAYGQNALKNLMNVGRVGWLKFQDDMDKNMSVGEKFSVMTDTLWGSLKRVWVHVQYVAIAIGEALAPAIRTIGSVLFPLLTAFQKFIQNNKELVQWIAGLAIGAIAAGAALFAIGTGFIWMAGVIVAFKGIAAAFAFFTTVLPVVLAIGVAVAAIGYALYSLYDAVPAIGEYFATWGPTLEYAANLITSIFDGALNALLAGDLELAWGIVLSGLEVAWIDFKSFLELSWLDTKDKFLTFVDGLINSWLGWTTTATDMIETFADAAVRNWNLITSAIEPAIEAAKLWIGIMAPFGAVSNVLNALGVTTPGTPGERAQDQAADRAIERGTAEANRFYERQAADDALAYQLAEAEMARFFADIDSATSLNRPGAPPTPDTGPGVMFGSALGSFSGAAVAAGTVSAVERTANASERTNEILDDLLEAFLADYGLSAV